RLPALERSQEAPDRQAVDARPGPGRSVEHIREFREGRHVPHVGLHRVRRVIPLLLQEVGKALDFLPHAATPTPAAAANAVMSASARSASWSFFFALSLGTLSSGSSRPKFAFIGWKCFGSASRR